jgi:Helix-turn-helix domain
MSESKLYFPDIAYIPYQLQVSEVLSDSAKIYCGQLKSICLRFNYVWATDEELASLKGVSKRTIQRWHDELEQAGFISRKCKNKFTDKEGEKRKWIRTRKMFVYLSPYDNPDWLIKNQKASSESSIPPDPLKEDESFSNNFSDSDIVGTVLDSDINDAVLDSDMDGASNRVNSKSESLTITRPSGVVVTFTLDKLELSHSLKQKILGGYSNEEIDIAVTRCLNWKGRPSDEIGIMTALKRANTWEDAPTVEEKKDDNLQFLKTLLKYDQKYIGNVLINVGNKYIEFVSGMTVTTFEIEQLDFKRLVTQHLEEINQIAEKIKNNSY